MSANDEYFTELIEAALMIRKSYRTISANGRKTIIAKLDAELEALEQEPILTEDALRWIGFLKVVRRNYLYYL